MMKRRGILAAAMLVGLACCLPPAVMAGPQVGDPALEFTAYDVYGNPHSLSDFQGKTVILNFWASW